MAKRVRIVLAWILVLLVLLSGTSTLAEDEIDLEHVIINNPFDEKFVCTVEEAIAFYDAFDEYPAHIDAIGGIESGTELYVWILQFTRWSNAAEQSCFGAGNATFALIKQAYIIAIQQMTDEEVELPEQNAYSRALEMATVDRELLTGEKLVAEDELAINLADSEVPLCAVDQAMAFYATIDAFYVESIDLGSVVDEETLASWAAQFYAWSKENWGPLRDEPCGQMQSFINFLESFAFGTALSQLTSGGPQTLNVFDDIMELLYDLIAEEMAALEAYEDE